MTLPVVSVIQKIKQEQERLSEIRRASKMKDAARVAQEAARFTPPKQDGNRPSDLARFERGMREPDFGTPPPGRSRGGRWDDAPVGRNQVAAETDFGGGFSPGDLLGPYHAARSDIPDVVRDPLKRVYEEAARTALSGGPLGRVQGEIAERIPVVNRIEQLRGKAASGLASTFTPREAWEVPLEAFPGTGKLGEIDELVAVVRKGGDDAIVALKRLAETPEGQRALRTLSSETGALKLPFGLGKTTNAAPSLPGGAVPPPSPALTAGSIEGEMLPTVNDKFIRLMADASLSPRQRNAILKSARRERAGKAAEAIRGGGSAAERLQGVRGAQSGKILPALNPVGDEFSPSEATQLYDQIDAAFDGGQIRPEEWANAVEAMQLLMTGGRRDPRQPLNLMPHERKLLATIFGPEFEAAIPKTKAATNLFQKAVSWASLPRAIKAAFDLSAAGRQGIMLAPRNPLEWGRAWGPMLKSFSSEQQYETLTRELMTNPRFDEAVEHGLKITATGGGVNAEEDFVSEIANKVPGIKNSERAYVMFLNHLRMSTYQKNADRLHRIAAKRGWGVERLESELDSIARFVNHASGQGDVGFLKEFVPAMNAVFFSPKFLASRFQAIGDIVTSSPSSRQMVAENLVGFVGSGMAMLTALKMSGVADVEVDPRSSDFGKARFGNQRIDFWGGFQPLARYTAQLASGEQVLPGVNRAASVGRGTVLKRFLRSKLSPAGGVLWDTVIAEGRTYDKKKLAFDRPGELADYALEQVTPLLITDIQEAWQTEGPKAIPGALLAGVGGNVQTFEPTLDKQEVAQKNASTAVEESPYSEIGLRVFGKLQERGLIPENYKTFEDFRADLIEQVGTRLEARGLPSAMAELIVDDMPEVKMYRDLTSGVSGAYRESDPDLLRNLIESGNKDIAGKDVLPLIASSR